MGRSFDPIFALGLMSGTSADGVDAALVKTDGESVCDFHHAITMPYDDRLRERLLEAAQNDVPSGELLELERVLTESHVNACDDVLLHASGVSREALQLIGFHGHTIQHDASRRLTWQLGDASLLSEAVGCPVVHDYRRRDIAAGGQGAPLAPLFHRMLFADRREPTVVLNLGGVANITWIGSDGAILAGDTGPGCGLLDAWAQKHLGKPFDCDGELARSGVPDMQIVREVMQMPFFQTPIPKSADRYEFHGIDLSRLNPADGAATLCAVTVAAVAATVSRLPVPPEAVWVTGGGTRHPVLMAMLQAELANVRPIESAGFRSDSLEAECFAWLAVRRIRDLPTSIPETTGCSRPTCGGSLTAEV